MNVYFIFLFKRSSRISLDRFFCDGYLSLLLKNKALWQWRDVRKIKKREPLWAPVMLLGELIGLWLLLKHIQNSPGVRGAGGDNIDRSGAQSAKNR